MNEENTILDRNEETVLGGSGAGAGRQVMDGNAEAPANKGGAWRKVAIGGVTGIALGAGATFLTGATMDRGEDGSEDGDAQAPESRNPVVDDSIPFATSVDDGMAFKEAFGAARAEVGTGGVFEWHGRLYNTFTAEEWDRMSDGDRAEYASHFDWSRQENPDLDYASHGGGGRPVEPQVIAYQEPRPQQAAQDLETAQVEARPVVDQESQPNDGDADVEVLGVVHDNETGANVVGILAQGQEILLIDVDDDGGLDIAISDPNNDGVIDQDEIVNISGAGLTIDDFGGSTNSPGTPYASTDEPDYVNDILEA